MTITKERIANDIFEQGVLPRAEAREAVSVILAIIKRTLAGGEDVLISGFGKFQVKSKRARRGRNPQTSEEIRLRPRRVVVFRNSGILRGRLNGEEEVVDDGFGSADSPKTRASGKPKKT